MLILMRALALIVRPFGLLPTLYRSAPIVGEDNGWAVRVAGPVHLAFHRYR
jgi:hypothetical protein